MFLINNVNVLILDAGVFLSDAAKLEHLFDRMAEIHFIYTEICFIRGKK